MRQNNYESLLTSIVSNNIGAKVFYSALGFDILGFEKNAIKIETPISMNIGFFL